MWNTVKSVIVKKAMYRYRKTRRIGSLLAAVLLMTQVFAFPSYALENWSEDCHVLSEGACLMDADSGVILFARNADEQYYPASITKVLTALLVIENCDNLSEMVTFSYDAVHIEEQNSTIIGASEGDRLSVLDCLYCLLFQSANEVANALAEHVGAGYPELKEKGESNLQVFVKLMNRKAEELGCTGSHFNNPSGLTDPEHYTTPHDMCLIMQAAIANETFADIESHTYWKHAPIRRYPDAEDPWNTVYMKHLMLRKNSNQYYQGCIAGKTGYTVTAGNTLVTACRRDGMTLVCCVMNAHANHYNDTIRLFDFGFANFRSVALTDHDRTNELVQSDFRISGIPVLDSMALAIDQNARVTLPKGGDISEVTQEFEVVPKPGDKTLAKVCYYYGDRLCGTASMELIPLGGMAEVREAGEDPMFNRIAGIEAEKTEPAGTEETGAEGLTGETVQEENTAGEEERMSGGETGADGAETDVSAGDQTEAGEEHTSEAVHEEGTDRAEGNTGKTVKIVCFALLGVVVVLGGFVILRYRAEMEQEKKRRARRKDRMRKVSDLTGSQQIDLDLQVRQKMDSRPVRKKRNGEQRKK